MGSRFRKRLAERIERRRVAFLNANRTRLPIVPRPSRLVVITRPGRQPKAGSFLQQVEDRRTFHPMRSNRPAAGLRYPRSRLVVAPAPEAFSPSELFSAAVPIGVSFRAPRQVAICVRRKVRREVIHAKGIAGGRVRSPRRNEYSGVQC